MNNSHRSCCFEIITVFSIKTTEDGALLLLFNKKDDIVYHALLMMVVCNKSNESAKKKKKIFFGFLFHTKSLVENGEHVHHTGNLWSSLFEDFEKNN